MAFKIERNDITKVHADAIVNTANHYPRIGSGTDTAVYNAAGWEELFEARKKIGILANMRRFLPVQAMHLCLQANLT